MKYKNIDYEILGSGIPVFILHGWGIDRTVMTAAFEPIFSDLGGYMRYYIDLPGMGRSKPGDVRNSDDILELLHSFAADVIGSPFILVGQSYGGLLARGFVRKYPELVNKLILLCPCVIPGVRQGNVEQLDVRLRDDELLSSLSKDEYDSFTYMNAVLSKPVWDRYRKYIMPALERADHEFLDNVLEGSFSFDPDDFEHPCDVPALIITAKQDSEVGFKDQFALMSKYTNSTYIAIENAGHNLQIEQPEMFESIVRSWLITH